MTEKEEKPKLTPSEEYNMLNEDLQKTLKVLIYKQLQFRLTHNIDDIAGSACFDASIERDFDYLKSLAF
jgi:hypothetical protein